MVRESRKKASSCDASVLCPLLLPSLSYIPGLESRIPRPSSCKVEEGKRLLSPSYRRQRRDPRAEQWVVVLKGRRPGLVEGKRGLRRAHRPWGGWRL